MHAPFMDLGELEILYLLYMAILDTSGSDGTQARSWSSAAKTTATMDLPNAELFTWSPK